MNQTTGSNTGESSHTYTDFNYLNDVDALTYVQNKASSGGAIVSKYDYSNIGLRTKKTLSGNAFSATTYDEYGYNSRHELTGSIRYNSGTPVTGKTYSYSYDNIGNRLDWYDGSSNTADKTNYAPTALHQYNGITGKHAESPVAYDTDGNLTDLDDRDFIYDGENRLIEVKVAGNTVATFKYDYLGRRTQKSTPSTTYTYLYDGWNLIAVYDDNGANHKPLITYTWGLDLSQSLQGAGGVGGLLMSYERSGSAWSYFQVGHGNVSQVIAQSNGTTTVKMEYDPYGRVISGTPGTGLRDVFRFSSKYYDTETGLYYYGFRYLDPVHGRWLNRDPIGERGGAHLYAFVRNRPISYVDAKGLNERDCSGESVVDNRTVATAVVPQFAKTGASTTGHRDGAKVECYCCCEKGSRPKIYKIECTVSYTPTIRVTLSDAIEHARLPSRIYGHEQSHVQSMNYRIQLKVIDPLKKEIGEKTYSNSGKCSGEAIYLGNRYSTKLRALVNDEDVDHRGDGHVNSDGDEHTPFSPRDREPHPPLEKTLPKILEELRKADEFYNNAIE